MALTAIWQEQMKGESQRESDGEDEKHVAEAKLMKGMRMKRSEMKKCQTAVWSRQGSSGLPAARRQFRQEGSCPENQ